ncbi:MAG TPA: type II toxin-antitoxin system VapC family toxin [Rhizomicrobium sp.]|jgi:predicted nucleic-acid-binding protein
MIGLDSNILLRYIVQDHPLQSPRATRFIETELTPDNPGFVSTVALAETVWVLGRSYRFKNEAVASAVERILEIDVLVVEKKQEVFTAMEAMRLHNHGFADVLIGALGASAGCTHTVTFDHDASGIPGFALL